jgi:hypothetical protein
MCGGKIENPAEGRNFTDRGILTAPQAGLEPATLRLTAGCSTIELLWNRYVNNTVEISSREDAMTILVVEYIETG